MSAKTEINTEFKIRTIDLLDSCLNAPNQQLGNIPIYEFDIRLEHRLKVADNIIIIISSVSTFSQDKKQLLGKVKTSRVYDIKSPDKFIDAESSKVRLPEDLVTTLNSISISTTRGMMFSFFRGTFLHNAILPVIDPKLFILKNSK